MEIRERAKQLIAQGFIFSNPDINFNANRPYVGCSLCGQVFQSRLDLRVPPGHEPHNSLIAKLAKNKRDAWALRHAETHTEHEHAMFRLSGRFATPEAAQELAARGLFSIIDIIVDNEVSDALAKGQNVPIREIER